MAASLIFSNPAVSLPFLGQKLSIHGGKSSSWTPAPQRLSNFRSLRCAAVDAPFGGNIGKFPRISVWDPYKRLGINRDASEGEVWSARNILLNHFADHERIFGSIEAAFERILMASFRNRKKTKINLKSHLKQKVEESPPWVKNLLGFVELPSGVIVLRRLFQFGFMACWSVMNSADAGPAFQVVISLAACIYFLNDKMKSLFRAGITGFLALFVGWFCGSLLIPMIPTVLVQPMWTLELLTSLIAYVFLFLACTFLK